MLKKRFNLILIFLLFFSGLCLNQVKVANSNTQLREEKVKYTGAESKRDPFMLPRNLIVLVEAPPKKKLSQEVKVILPQVSLQGIIYKKNGAQAILNGNVVQVGEYIEKFEIKEIKKKSIILYYKGKDYEIHMQGY